MGLKDEDYREALIQQHMKAHLEYLKKQKDEEMLRTSAVVDNTNTITSNQAGTIHINQGGMTTTYTGTGGGGGGTWATREPLGVKTITEKDLKHDAMQAPLSALVDMWTVRWQGEWVNEAEFDEDDFWRLALVRLLGANKLEKHNLANQYRSVYRIIE